jgi:hypothetical protein
LRRAGVLPEFHFDPGLGGVDADMCLDEPPHEHVWAPEVCGHRLQLPQPTAGVDEDPPITGSGGEVGE